MPGRRLKAASHGLGRTRTCSPLALSFGPAKQHKSLGSGIAQDSRSILLPACSCGSAELGSNLYIIPGDAARDARRPLNEADFDIQTKSSSGPVRTGRLRLA